jgi:hypothetical protein
LRRRSPERQAPRCIDIDSGLLPYGVVVDPLEELTELLPLVMATHGMNDLYGKLIGPLALMPLIEPAQSSGIDLTNLRDDSPLVEALLVYSAVANTALMNLFVRPVLG